MLVSLGTTPLRIIGHVSISAKDTDQPIIQFVLGNEAVDANTIWTTWDATDMIISNNPIWIKFIPRDANSPQDVKVDVRRIS